MLAKTTLFKDVMNICYASITLTGVEPCAANITQLYETAIYISNQPDITHIIIDFRNARALSYVQYIKPLLNKLTPGAHKRYANLQIWFGPNMQVLAAIAKPVVASVNLFETVNIQCCA